VRYTEFAGDSGNRVATSLYIRMEFGPAVSEPPNRLGQAAGCPG
jgi:hypothetical protein